MRKIRIFQPYTYFSLDYAAQEIKCYRLREGPMDRDNPKPIMFDDIRVEKDQPLKRQLDAFVESILEGRPPMVTARHGRDALEVATRIIEVMRSKKYE
jgi:predicted dehydrogenase